MPMYQFHCDCGHVTDARFQYESRPTHVPCEICQGPAEYRIGAPMVMSVALPDGTKRKGFDVLKEAARLKVEAAELPQNKRAEINKEIHKVQSIKK